MNIARELMPISLGMTILPMTWAALDGGPPFLSEERSTPVPLFWLTYRHPDGRAGGVVVVDASDVLQARFKAEVYGLDLRLDFTHGRQLDPISAAEIPANMIGRFLDDGDLGELHQLLVRKNPPGLPARRRTAAKGRAAKS